MRLVGALAALALAFGLAWYVHQRHTWRYPKIGYGTPMNARTRVHPGWEDPAAIVIAIGGVAVAAAVLTVGRRRA
jgi:hypothetical protein